MEQKVRNKVLNLIGLSLMALSEGITEEELSRMISFSVSTRNRLGSITEDELNKDVTREYIYGIRGLGDYLGVSAVTAQKYVNQGKLDPAIRKIGKKVSFLKKKVDEIFSVAK